MEWFSEKGISNGDTEKLLDDWKIIKKKEFNSNVKNIYADSSRHSKS